MEQIITQAKITDIIPHRFENVLIDQVTIVNTDTVDGELTLTLKEDDKRTVFTFTPKPDLQALLIPAYLEFLALGAIVCVGLPKDYSVFFAGISNVHIHGYSPVGELLTGHVKQVSQKSGFFRSDGVLFSQGKEIAKGEMLAYFGKKSETADSDGPKKTIQLSPPGDHVAIDRSRYDKQESMVVLDHYEGYNAEENAHYFAYTYPEDHMFTKGHYPGNPIMMGIMQWMTCEDACYALCSQLGVFHDSGLFILGGHADIVKSDGTVVAEIKSFKVRTYKGVDGYHDHSEMAFTKKIAFRDFVLPGESLMIRIRDLKVISD